MSNPGNNSWDSLIIWPIAGLIFPDSGSGIGRPVDLAANDCLKRAPELYYRVARGGSAAEGVVTSPADSAMTASDEASLALVI